MTRRLTTHFVFGFMTVILLVTSLARSAQAIAPGNEAFERIWARADRPVAEGHADRTWLWGPEAFTEVLKEPYQESPNGSRHVQYFDKSRMEITDPNADSNSIWYVTNGLLTVELITGQMQVGDNQFVGRSPALVNVAGDADDPTGPTYATFRPLMDVPSRGHGKLIIERVDRAGNITSDPSLGKYGMNTMGVDQVTNHSIAYPFSAFMESHGIVYENGFKNDSLFENPYFATGRPITEAYWANVKVGGIYKDVLMQCFERRCLTFTPDNPPGWQVEAGNVGQHYYAWRYGDPTPKPSPMPDPLPDTATTYTSLQTWGIDATDITIDNPSQIAIAPTGEIYVASTSRHQILKFAPDGVLLDAWPAVSRAGSGEGEFNGPTGVAVDASAYVYVADYGNDRIQKFNEAGDFVTSWGATGAAKGNFDGPYGVSVGQYAATGEDTVYVTELGNHRVQQFSRTGTFINSWGGFGNGPDELSAPHGITAVGPHIIFIADTGNSRIQMRNSFGELLGNFGSAGSDAGQLLLPTAVGVSSSGDILVSELGNDRVQRFTLTNPSTLKYEHGSYWGAKGGAPGMFENPKGITTDFDGNVYIADSDNNRIQKFDDSGNYLDEISDGNHGRLKFPVSVTVNPDGRVFVVDPELDVVQAFTPEGELLDRWGPEIPGTKRLDGPRDIAFDASGNAYVLCSTRVIKLNSDGEFLGEFSTLDTMGYQYSLSSAIAVDDNSNIYIADTDRSRIQKFAPDFSFIMEWSRKPATGTAEFFPIDIETDGDRVFVFDLDGRVTVFDLHGAYLHEWVLTRNEASKYGLVAKGLTIDRDGYVYTADASNLIQKFTPEGQLVASIAEPGTGDGQLEVVHGLAVDDDLRIYASETAIQGQQSRVEVFAPVN